MILTKFSIVYEMSSFTSDELQHFCKTDQLNATDVSLVQSDILCECMQMKYQVIQDVITQRVITLDAISKKTVSGTVCRSCHPKIKKLLG